MTPAAPPAAAADAVVDRLDKRSCIGAPQLAVGLTVGSSGDENRPIVGQIGSGATGNGFGLAANWFDVCTCFELTRCGTA